jgi:hypothetical protein
MARRTRTVLIRQKKVRGPESGKPKGNVPAAEQREYRAEGGQ